MLTVDLGVSSETSSVRRNRFDKFWSRDGNVGLWRKIFTKEKIKDPLGSCCSVDTVVKALILIGMKLVGLRLEEE